MCWGHSAACPLGCALPPVFCEPTHRYSEAPLPFPTPRCQAGAQPMPDWQVPLWTNLKRRGRLPAQTQTWEPFLQCSFAEARGLTDQSGHLAVGPEMRAKIRALTPTASAEPCLRAEKSQLSQLPLSTPPPLSNITLESPLWQKRIEMSEKGSGTGWGRENPGARGVSLSRPRSLLWFHCIFSLQ